MLAGLHGVIVAAGGHDLASVAKAIVVEAMGMVNASRATLFLWNEQEEALQAVHHGGRLWKQEGTEAALAVAAGAFKAGHPKQIEVESAGILIAVPIRISRRTIGCLTLAAPSRWLAPLEIDRLQDFAELAAPHLETAMAVRAWKREAGFQASVHRAAVALAGVTDANALVRTAIDSVTQILDCAVAAVHWWDSEVPILRSYAGRGGPDEVIRGVAPDKGVSALAFHRRRPQATEAYSRRPPEIPYPLGQGLESALAVPLVSGESAMGALAAYRRTRTPFTGEEVRILTSLAELVASAATPLQLSDAGRKRWRELMTLTMNNAPMIFWSVNQDHIVTVAEGHGLDRSGLPLSFFIGKRFEQIFRQNPEVVGALELALGGAEQRIEYTYQQTGNRWEAFLVPLHDDDGAVVEVCGVAIDRTVQWEAEEARRENEAKSRFLAVVTHELRTPLNAILGFSQLLQRPGRLSDREKRYVSNIVVSGQHLLTLINDLLDMAKIQAGKLHIKPERIDLGALVRATAEMVSPLATARSLRLSTEVPGNLAMVTDGHRLQQVLVNLLSNAIKFTEAGGRILVSATTDQDWVSIEVEDSGIGMGPRELELIFQEFIQVDSDLQRSQRGTGLGLAVSRRLVELMGGQLSARSTPGKGSVFTIRLPLALDSSVAIA